MIRRSALAILVLALAVPAHAGFNEVLSGLENKLGRSTWIPMFGFVRTAVRIGHPRGVHDLQLAVFEGKGTMDIRELDTLMTSRMGRGYTPLVRVRSRHDRESTLIYAKPANGLIDLLLLTNDSEDTVLVRVVVAPDVVTHYLDADPASIVRVARQ